MLVGVGHQALGSFRNERLAHHPKTKLPGLCLSVRLQQSTREPGHPKPV
jgi:hypothetical protein